MTSLSIGRCHFGSAAKPKSVSVTSISLFIVLRLAGVTLSPSITRSKRRKELLDSAFRSEFLCSPSHSVVGMPEASDTKMQKVRLMVAL